ncbi:MAG TPA: HAMP domain-containing sensor histidine kinase [Gemmatimonadaceae bacterium]|nr:HAMP domain-containing sensor histidine kinase [Gemmatimonadaceae bacterium]
MAAPSARTTAPLTGRHPGTLMRLADFLRAHCEPILVEWEAFARSCAPAGRSMDVDALRDHASQMLAAIADDLAAAQNPRAEAERARGEAVVAAARSSAAGRHGAGRAESGFTVAQMTAEYRALRASVVRLWTAAQGGALAAADVEDLTRFHEAIDQALAESLVQFETGVEQAKETFLAILGHDLRTPLGAIQTSAMFLLDKDAVAASERPLAAQIVGSARRAGAMVGELLDFTRSRLGGGIPVVRTEGDLLALVREAAAEVAAAHPDRIIDVRTPDLPAGAPFRARFDAARLGQALGNLLGNAVQHGGDGPVTVTIRAGGAETPSTPGRVVTVAVHNSGRPIAAAQLDGLFNPLQSRAVRPVQANRGPTSSLGLGLYIAERIVHAHGGHLAVTSGEEQGTTFTMTLPRD